MKGIHVRHANTPGLALAASVERLDTSQILDWKAGAWVVRPTSPANLPTMPLPEMTLGLYAFDIDPSAYPSAPFLNGGYALGIHLVRGGACIAVVGFSMFGGDDAPTFPAHSFTITETS